MKTVVRSALILPGLVAATQLVPTPFGVADPDGIWSMQTNPAGLGRMKSWELGAQTAGRQDQSQDLLAGGVDGFAAGWDELPGTWVTSVRESDFRLGLGGYLGRGLYAGATGVRHKIDGQVQGWSLDLGLLWQPVPQLSVGWSIPNWRSRDPSRNGGNALGVAFRPTGAVDLQVGMEAWLTGPAWSRLSWDQPVWEAAARIRPVPWLTLDGRVDPLHPDRIGGAVAIQVAPNLSIFGRSAPAPQPSSSEFQGLGVKFSGQSRPASVAQSPVLVYRIPADLSDLGGGLRRVRADFVEMASVSGLRTVAIDLGNKPLGPVAAGELRRQILFLRSHGIEVWAWARDLDMGTLAVLASANHAALDPEGMVRSRGFAMDLPYFGGALRRHGVQVQVVKTGPWKSAMEPFEADRMSPQAREDLEHLLFDLDSSVMAGVVTDRHLDPAALVAFVDSGSVLPKAAVRARVVDTLLEEADLGAWAGVPKRGPLALPLHGEARETWGEGRRVAVLLLDGQVVDREGEAGMAPWSRSLSAEKAVREIDKLRADPSVGAVVLRVNSPGGSVAGSERLRHAVEKLAARKTVVVSMGSVAASGAYLFALPAARIYAEPEAMVGSIGAFAAKANVQGLMDSLGIRVERIKTAPHAGAMSPFVPFDSLETARVAEFVEDAHRDFAEQVRSHRHLDSAAFLRVDGGRIFSGGRAVEVGLVDAVGDVDDAVLWAREKAGLPATAPVVWSAPPRRGWTASVGLAAQALSRSLDEEPEAAEIGRVRSLLSRGGAGVWAQVPWEPLWE